MNGLAAGSWASDRFGERAAAVDADGRPVELRRLPEQFNVLEPALAAAIARLREFDRPSIARVLGLEIDDRTGCLVLVSEHVPGLRLADLQRAAGEQSVVAEIGAALFVMRRLLSTLESLRSVTGLPQFCIAPDCIVITPCARVVIAEPALGMATVFSSAPNDVAGTALVGIAMILGRAIDDAENIDPLSPVLQDVADVAAIRGGDEFSFNLRLWLEKAIADPSFTFSDFRQARLALQRVKIPSDAGGAGSRRALSAFLGDLALESMTGETAAKLEADRLCAVRARQVARRSEISAPDHEWVAVDDEAAPTLDRQPEAAAPQVIKIEEAIGIEPLIKLSEPAPPNILADVTEEPTSPPEDVEQPVAGAPLEENTRTWYQTLIEQFRAARESAIGSRQPVEPVAEAPPTVPPAVQPVARPHSEQIVEGFEELLSEAPEPVAESVEEIDEPAPVVEIAAEPATIVPVAEETSVDDEIEPVAQTAETPALIEPSEPIAEGSEEAVALEAPEPIVGEARVEPELVEEDAQVDEEIQEPTTKVAQTPAPVELVPEPVAEMAAATGAPETVGEIVEEPVSHSAPADLRAESPEEPPAPVAEPPAAESDDEARSAWIRSLTLQLGLALRDDVAPERGVAASAEDDAALEPVADVVEMEMEEEDSPQAPAEIASLKVAETESPAEIESSEWQIDAPADVDWRETATEETSQEPAEAQPLDAILTADPDRAPESVPPTARADAGPASVEPAPAQDSIGPPPLTEELERWARKGSRPLRDDEELAAMALAHPVESVVHPSATDAQPTRAESFAKRPKGRKILVPPQEVKRAVSAGLLLGIGAVLISGLAVFGRNYYIRTTMPGSVVVESTPRGSQVLVDGVARGVTPLTLSLAPGRHVLELRRGGATHELSVNVEPGGSVAERIDWSTVRSVGGMAIASTPAGARVIVDGKERGVTPLTLSDLPVGTHSIVLESSAGTVRREVRITAGGLARLDETIISGWIAVFAPFELQVYERQRVIGSTETERIMMPPGRHEVELVNKRLGYRETRTIDLGPGETVPINVTGATGVVQVNAPPGAEVFIDGQLFGETPIRELRVPLGTHEILVRHPQRGEQRVTTTVTFGAPTEINVDFKE